MRTTAIKSTVALLFIAASIFSNASGDDAPSRIIAVGDLHGDYDAYELIMTSAGLIDKRGRWTGGDTVLVQTGDIADRGPDSRKIFQHLKKLEKRAVKKGGKIVALVGNHEAMNMTNDLRYVHDGEYAAFSDSKSNSRRSIVFEANRESVETFYLENDPTMSSESIRAAWYEQWPLGRVEHQLAWTPDGEIGEWVAGNRAVAKIGDTLFVHGGLSAEYSGFSLDDINARVSSALAAQDATPDSILSDPLGPLWYRGLIRRDAPAPITEAGDAGTATEATAPRPSIAEEVDIVLAAYGVARIVVGHTPNLEGIRDSAGGRVIQIDTGASDYYGGVASYLEIMGDKVTAHNLTTGETRMISASGESVK